MVYKNIYLKKRKNVFLIFRLWDFDILRYCYLVYKFIRSKMIGYLEINIVVIIG